MYENQFTSSAFQNYLNEEKLMGTRCASCGALHLPPRPLCPACGEMEMEWIAFNGEGTLAAFTVVHIAPSAMLDAGYGRDNPYCSGVVALAEGPSISAQILGVDVAHPEKIAIGTPLKVVFIQREGPKAEGKRFIGFEPLIG